MNIQNTISLLQANGMTQSKIASYLGCTQSNISCFLRGKHGSVRPSSKVVDGLRKLLIENGLEEPLETS